MTPPRDHKQSVEVIDKTIRTAFLVRKMLALSSLNTPLKAVLMQAAEDLLD
jgi:hypothetical protein